MKAEDYRLAMLAIYKEWGTNYGRRKQWCRKLKLQAEREFQQEYKELITFLYKVMPLETCNWVFTLRTKPSSPGDLRSNMTPSQHKYVGKVINDLLNPGFSTKSVTNLKSRLSKYRSNLVALLLIEYPHAPDWVYFPAI